MPESERYSKVIWHTGVISVKAVCFHPKSPRVIEMLGKWNGTVLIKPMGWLLVIRSVYAFRKFGNGQFSAFTFHQSSEHELFENVQTRRLPTHCWAPRIYRASWQTDSSSRRWILNANRGVGGGRVWGRKILSAIVVNQRLPLEQRFSTPFPSETHDGSPTRHVMFQSYCCILSYHLVLYC